MLVRATVARPGSAGPRNGTLAARAGLGWNRQNTMLLHPELAPGSSSAPSCTAALDFDDPLSTAAVAVAPVSTPARPRPSWPLCARRAALHLLPHIEHRRRDADPALEGELGHGNSAATSARTSVRGTGKRLPRASLVPAFDAYPEPSGFSR